MKIDSEVQKADIFTKGLPMDTFEKIRGLLMGWWCNIIEQEGEQQCDKLPQLFDVNIWSSIIVVTVGMVLSS